MFSPKFSRGGVLKSLANFHKFPQCRVGGGMGFTTKYYRGDRGMGWCVCVYGGGGGGGVVGENFEKVRFDPLPTIRVCTFSGHLTHKG